MGKAAPLGSRQRARPAQNGPGAPGAARSTPVLEWIVGGLGAALVLGAIAFLVAHALRRERTPPDVRVEVEAVLEQDNGYLVQFRAVNQGRSAAAEVPIEGELHGPDGPRETSEAVLDYLPPRSSRRGGLFFTRDPRQFDLQLRAKGYAEP